MSSSVLNTDRVTTVTHYLSEKWKHFKKDRHLLLLFLPCFIFFVVFKYTPMAGVFIAFQDYGIYKGILGSPFVGFKHFITFFTSPDFFIIIRNTFILGFYGLIIFPLPIIFALLLNEIKNVTFKRAIQTISYLPFFLSVVVVCAMTWSFLSPNDGLINKVIMTLGFEPQYFMADSKWFRSIYILTGIWQFIGYNSIIFIAAISGVSTEIYDAAEIDGCGRFGKVIHVTVPSIMATIVVMFILTVGSIVFIGFEKVLLLQTPATYDVSDVIDTYVYRRGLKEASYSFATAVGLFESLISLILLTLANFLSKKVTETSIW